MYFDVLFYFVILQRKITGSHICFLHEAKSALVYVIVMAYQWKLSGAPQQKRMLPIKYVASLFTVDLHIHSQRQQQQQQQGHGDNNGVYREEGVYFKKDTTTQQ